MVIRWILILSPALISSPSSYFDFQRFDVISIHIQMFATTGQVNDKEWDEWFGLLLSTSKMVGTGILNCLCVTWKAGRARLLIWAWTTTFCSLPSSSSSPARGEPLNGSQDATEAHTHGGESSSSGFHPSYWTQHKRKPPDSASLYYIHASPLFPRGTLLGKDGGDGIARAARIRVARSSGIDLPRRWNTAKNR